MVQRPAEAATLGVVVPVRLTRALVRTVERPRGRNTRHRVEEDLMDEVHRVPERMCPALQKVKLLLLHKARRHTLTTGGHCDFVVRRMQRMRSALEPVEDRPQRVSIGSS